MTAQRLPFVDLTQEEGRCRLEPDTNYRFVWTEAAGTWSYLSDSWIMGLPEAPAQKTAQHDPLRWIRVQLAATVADQDGQVMPGAAFTWSQVDLQGPVETGSRGSIQDT